MSALIRKIDQKEFDLACGKLFNQIDLPAERLCKVFKTYLNPIQDHLQFLHEVIQCRLSSEIGKTFFNSRTVQNSQNLLLRNARRLAFTYVKDPFYNQLADSEILCSAKVCLLKMHMICIVIKQEKEKECSILNPIRKSLNMRTSADKLHFVMSQCFESLQDLENMQKDGHVIIKKLEKEVFEDFITNCHTAEMHQLRTIHLLSLSAIWTASVLVVKDNRYTWMTDPGGFVAVLTIRERLKQNNVKATLKFYNARLQEVSVSEKSKTKLLQRFSREINKTIILPDFTHFNAYGYVSMMSLWGGPALRGPICYV